MAQPIPAQRMEHVIHTYIQACNDADAAAIAACFCPEAVYYLPPPRRKWSGAITIGSHFAQIVQEHGVYWTVDHLLIDGDRCAAALEWTRFDWHHAQIIRGGRLVRLRAADLAYSGGPSLHSGSGPARYGTPRIRRF